MSVCVLFNQDAACERPRPPPPVPNLQDDSSICEVLTYAVILSTGQWVDEHARLIVPKSPGLILRIIHTHHVDTHGALRLRLALFFSLSLSLCPLSFSNATNAGLILLSGTDAECRKRLCRTARPGQGPAEPTARAGRVPVDLQEATGHRPSSIQGGTWTTCPPSCSLKRQQSADYRKWPL